MVFNKQNVGIPLRLGLLFAFSLILISCSDSSATTDSIDSASRHDRDDEDEHTAGLTIKKAKWDSDKMRITIKGKSNDDARVSVFNAATGFFIDDSRVKKDKWRVKEELKFGSVPCRIRAEQGDQSAEMDVKDAPADCDDGGGNGGGNGGGGTPLAGNFQILAANDLGMHCADQDFRVFSILPPYNVLNAQVLKKGLEPQLMSPADGVHVTYKAIESNYFSDLTDPTRSPDSTNSITATGGNLPGVFKNNFWGPLLSPTNPAVNKIGFKAYENLYPPGVLAMFGSDNDVGLPAPDVEHFYLLSDPRELLAEQSVMPGVLTNEPQPFHGYVENFPFFVDFPFGYTVANFNRYTAEGVPISAVDDVGRSNPYPLLRIEARDSANNVLAAVDAVAPVASEADCAICHAVQDVCDLQMNGLVCYDIANFNYEDKAAALGKEFIIDASGVIGDTPEQKVINSAKTNILRLHDIKHLTSLAGNEPDGTKAGGSTPNVVCANCHYSPALDLAHLGPNDSNGKEQTQHISMSRAMHGVHGSLATNPLYTGFNLFPTMPPPGEGRDPVVAKGVLMETCYNCHPGKRAECLRGAMGGSGTVCQDCHGQLTQVGDDFTEGFPDAGFPAGADLTKRVSWASEPGCDSCHVGDAMQVAQLNLADTVINTTDAHGNADGLRLLMTYNLSNHKDNNGPDNLPLLKFPESRFATTESLYRLSGADNAGLGMEKGHGGLSCEGCHGSTHAIWPNANPFANDNKAANDIQGHSGPIIECASCHEGDLGNTLDGPHGMHPVGDTGFSDGGHEDMAELNNGDSCRACHGLSGEGSVLSRAATDRTLQNEGQTVSLLKGELVTCTLCHDNEL